MEFDFVKWIDHAGFLIETPGIKIAIDPFRVRSPEKLGKADIIFITHSHFDHLSDKDISALSGANTTIVAPNEVLGKLRAKAFGVEPGKHYAIEGIEFDTVPAYNIKPERLNYHPRSNGWVGYVINAGKKKIYHAGDTDFVEEMKHVSADLALLPIGGTYTMTVDEAIEAAKAIKAKYFAPMHYKSLLGQNYKQAEETFKSKIRNSVIFEQVEEPFYSF
ncbi:MAG: MBL fold metallo-hydrolase [Candidatus Micrarchaeia archaeon]